MSFIRDGQAWLNDTMAEVAGVTIVYSRPATGQSVTLTHDEETNSGGAWVGRTVFRQQPQAGAGGAQVIFGERDYLIPVASLVLGGSATVPARGDRITEAGAGTFEVQPPANREPLWRFSDQTRTVFRIHCKRVS